MTTNHALPWTLTRYIADLFSPPTKRDKDFSAIMSGRESAARALFSEQVGGSQLDMLEYDNSPRLRGGWLAEADRRIAGGAKVELSELLILRHWGYTPAEWVALTNEVRAAKRDGYYQAKGLGA